MAAGRTAEARSVAGLGTTLGAAAITFPANGIVEEDAGRAISGAGIPANATVATVTSTTTGTISPNATATATITATLGAGGDYGFSGWSPETDAESESYTVAANNAGTIPPGRITDTSTPITQRART